MSDFGDFDSDDAVDLEPPDPEQVAMKLHQFRIDIGDSCLSGIDYLTNNRSLELN
jgi:hypothetical protein